ncbi:FAD/NAD(P)-binding domain-containing protein [Gymnopus androsaceus JB14]|uniref:FAD/NAD(P)-binding domain-containing protein n=1 Tax=Gymnopus androsaceus JB14 TaxID=1447944 RepID=A0A6A4HLY5_9AGAR|nr:FAD/NAD(P)-binding domain-containing protein [Gymnopus androsaceus JB14]
MTEDLKNDTRIAIIGAGVGGITMGIALRRQMPGFENFVIYEKSDDVGGTWKHNVYPGCSSDLAIHFYSLSTDPKSDWDHSHEYQPQIQSYWADLVKKYNLRPHISFQTAVVSAEWNRKANVWRIITEDVATGIKQESTAKILISAQGLLDVPNYPNVPGLDTFKGIKFHSAKYDNSVSLRGKRVGIIGNGASATQMIPVISADPSVKLVQFARTPNWFLPLARAKYSTLMKWMFAHVPFVMKTRRFMGFLEGEMLYFSIFGTRFLHPTIEKIFKGYVRRTAPEKYQDKLIPSYQLGCRRLLFDNGYLASLHRPNVTMDWSGIDSFVEDGIMTKTGEKVNLDVIIISTGFITDDFPFFVKGLETTIKNYYDLAGGPKAYKGTSIPGFPNFYLILGPNSGTGHTSFIYMEEIQIDYILKMIGPILSKQVSAFNVKHTATDQYNDWVHARLGKVFFWAVHLGIDEVEMERFPISSLALALSSIYGCVA